MRIAAIVLGCTLAACQAGAAPARRAAAPPAAMLPARPGDIAVREEFAAARRAGTRAGYSLFIARHPDHPLARLARRERARLATPGGR